MILKSITTHFVRTNSAEYEQSKIINAAAEYPNELRDGLLSSEQEQKLNTLETDGTVDDRSAEMLYSVVRTLKPETVIETGVCNGLSSLAILTALEKNGAGQLYSIDYPFSGDNIDQFRAETYDEFGGATTPNGHDIGWLVHDELRHRWDHRLGKSQRKLPKLITELAHLDLFLHDSEHSVPCMMFEFELAWEHLNEGGVLLSDDITWNDSFEDFCEYREKKYGYLTSNIGYTVK